MSKFKKVLVGVGVVVTILVLNLIVQNLVGFSMPETVEAPMAALIGIAVYQAIEEKMNVKEK